MLVALGIVAIALAAGLQATTALTNNAQRQSDVLLAQMCAENELVRVRLARQMPGVGEQRVGLRAGQHRLRGRGDRRAHAQSELPRVDAQVFEGGSPVLRISTVVGRY